MNDETPNTELQVYEPPQNKAVSVFLDMRLFEDAQRVCKALQASSIVPEAFRKNLADCLIAYDMAMRIGLSPISVMQSGYVVHGKFGWEAKFLISAVNASGRFRPLDYEFRGEGDEWACRAWTTERGRDEKLYGPWVSIGMAKKEGWHQRSGSKWQSMPELMLTYRAAAFWVRTRAPEFALGMQTVEELRDVYDARPGKGEAFLPYTHTIVGSQSIEKPPEVKVYEWPKLNWSSDDATQEEWVDSAGEVFNPDLHVWGKDDKPAVNQDGTFRMRPKRKSASVTVEPQIAHIEPKDKSPLAALVNGPPVDIKDTWAGAHSRPEGAPGYIESLEMLAKADKQDLDDMESLVSTFAAGSSERMVLDKALQGLKQKLGVE